MREKENISRKTIRMVSKRMRKLGDKITVM